MFIDEIPNGTNLDVIYNIGIEEHKIICETVTGLSSRDRLALNQAKRKLGRMRFIPIKIIITEDDIDISEKQLNISNVTYVKEEKPYIWDDIKIARISLPDYGYINILISESNVKSHNRRDNYRLWIGIDGDITVVKTSLKYNVTVKDISSTGVGLITDIESECNIGDNIQIRYDDTYFDSKEKSNTTKHFTINAIIVRQVLVDAKHKIVGCEICKSSSELTKYIYTKQINKLHMNKSLSRRDKL